MGALVLLGWALDIQTIKSLGQPVSMNPMAAVAFLIGGVSLWLSRAESPGRGRSWASRVLVSAVILVAMLRLAEDWLGWQVGIDRVLFNSRLNDNQMAPNTAFNFLLVGLALVLLPAKGRASHHLTLLLVMAAAAVALLAVVGYAYGSKAFYRVSYFIPMALNTAFGFFVLCSAILCARPSREPLVLLISDSAGGATARRLLPAAIVVPLLFGWLQLRGLRAGLYGTELGIALMVVSFTLVFAALVWLNARLQHRTDLERQRASRMLRQSAEAAEAANRSKSEFLANMSHEIRTPMTAILGYADMLLDPHQSPSDRLDHVQTVRRNAEHLLTILNDILDLSKIEAGRLDLECIPAQPRQIVTEVLSLMRVRAVEKGITLDVTYAGPIPQTIRTDPTRLRQVLINLVGNAIKFTNTGGVNLVVTLGPNPGAEDSLLEFAIIDSGIGLTAEQIARLFRPFEQADSSTTRRFGGTGLGLTICKRLAGMLGGDIVVQSQLGRGSRFVLSIRTGDLSGVPLTHESHEAVKPQDQLPEPAAVGRLSGRVLLAEDGVHNQRVISYYLQTAGADVTLADDGRVACQKAMEASAAGRPFDVILMDMQMPEMDGYTAAATLRGKGYGGPIIALTAHAMSHDRDKCLSAGCTDYLTKPIDRHLLLRTVGTHLGAPAAAVMGTGATPRTDDPRTEILRSTLADTDVMPFLPAFVSDMPALVGKLAALLDQQDLEELRQTVHQLKGAGGLYGFMPLTDAATTLEDRLLAGEPIETVAAGIEEFIDLIRRVEGYDRRREPASIFRSTV